MKELKLLTIICHKHTSFFFPEEYKQDEITHGYQLGIENSWMINSQQIITETKLMYKIKLLFFPDYKINKISLSNFPKFKKAYRSKISRHHPEKQILCA